jgi:hypothetical protein
MSLIASAMNSDAKTPGEGAEPVLDLDHLNRQTMGNRALEREVLSLFDDHAARTLGLIQAADMPDSRREMAHSLVGAARGIGAFRAAAAAAAIEAGTDDSPQGLAALEAAIGEVRRAIAAHLSE